MFCRFCGSVIPSDSVYCSSCGKRLITEVSCKTVGTEEPKPKINTNDPLGNVSNNDPWRIDKNIINSNVNNEQHESKAWRIFANIGFTFGIISIIFCWVPLLTAMFSIHGLILCAIGKKSKKEIYHSRAIVGLFLTILSAIVSFIFYAALI
jgi:hypothetical protein